MLGNSFVAEQLAASQEGLDSVELVSCLKSTRFHLPTQKMRAAGNNVTWFSDYRRVWIDNRIYWTL
jgi:hypothetical protein